MCGLFGSQTKGKLNPEQRKQRTAILKGLACAMQRRGDDSTGVAFIGLKKYRIIKDAQKASEFVNQYEIDYADCFATIGHTRFATTGAVTKKNAHPFQRGSIVGAHNGHVSNHYSIDAKAEVDSEVIFSELNKTDNDFVSTFKKLNGMFAITWADLNTNNVYLVREDNPLYITHVKSLKSYFWASDDFDLRAVIAACTGQTPKIIDIDKNTVLEIQPNQKVTRHKVKFGKAYTYKKVDTAEYYHGYCGFKDAEEEYISEEYTQIDNKWEGEECFSCGHKIPKGQPMWFNDACETYCDNCYETQLSKNPESYFLMTA